MEALVRVGTLLAVLMIMLLWEAFRPRRPLARPRQERWRTNLSLTLLNTVLVWITVGGVAYTAAVRMSFQTVRPFFPYREPAVRQPPDKKARERLLRVYFLADARFRGTVGDYEPWPGAAVWSNTIGTAQLAELLRLVKLPALAGGGGRRLTEFEDRSSPRPGTGELFFERAADQSTLERPAIYTGLSGLAILATAILVILGGIWFLVKRRRA